MVWLLAILGTFSFTFTYGQEGEEDVLKTNEAFEQDIFVVDFKVAEYVEIGEEVTFDASPSTPGAPSLGQVNYTWSFGDASRPQWGERVNYTFNEPGTYEVILRMKQGQKSEEKRQMVKVYEKKMVLVTDQMSRLDQIQDQAASQGIWLKTISYDTQVSEFEASEKFIQNIQSNTEFLREAEFFIFYDNSLQALQLFAQNWRQTDPEKVLDPQEKIWISIYDKSLNKALQTFKPAFNILQPKNILLTRVAAIDLLFEEKQITSEMLESRGIEFVPITINIFSASPFLFISSITNLFITKGIPTDVIYLLFAVPFIAFVIAFFRQFVGVATLGVYAPLMLTLSFMVLGLKFGFIVFVLVMVVSYLIRTIFEKVELLYIPKVALLLSVLSLSFFLILGAAIYLNPSTNLALFIFPMLVMATLSEKFLSAQSESGLTRAFIAMAETVIISMIGFALVQSDFVRTSVLAHPEWIFLPMIGIIWLGRFTGLRVSEYLKFRAFFKEDVAEEE